MTFRSYSKINFTLEVGSKRADGYHSLESIVQTISLYDTISIERADNPEIRITCSHASVPTDEKNTVYKIRELFINKYNINKGLRIHIEKNIPSQAGLGGGSGNASYTLLALNRLFGTSLSAEELAELSSHVGSDCPLFIYGGTVFMTGRGEIIKPLKPFPKFYFLIVKPDFSVSTKEAYRKLDERTEIKISDKSSLLVSLNEKNLLTELNIGDYLTNDFELLCKDKTDKIKAILKSKGALCSLLCGSGSCIFGIFPNREKQTEAYNSLRTEYSVFLAESL
ncbi:MAG: 4-(cytidine 5'-diphospho)-2-C-methyl-D-erythritol kinase [Armatimonadetes bacterium]|nr:4-(cytidine 5'-diphospho)-2-C-methyl-D-erythritol kinase [Candidatus Hippobium faecium]